MSVNCGIIIKQKRDDKNSTLFNYCCRQIITKTHSTTHHILLVRSRMHLFKVLCKKLLCSVQAVTRDRNKGIHQHPYC